MVDVDQCKTRKALQDSLFESEKHQKEHELELKQELAAAKRNDMLQGIKEKQSHLQGH